MPLGVHTTGTVVDVAIVVIALMIVPEAAVATAGGFVAVVALGAIVVRIAR